MLLKKKDKIQYVKFVEREAEFGMTYSIVNKPNGKVYIMKPCEENDQDAIRINYCPYNENDCQSVEINPNTSHYVLTYKLTGCTFGIADVNDNGIYNVYHSNSAKEGEQLQVDHQMQRLITKNGGELSRTIGIDEYADNVMSHERNLSIIGLWNEDKQIWEWYGSIYARFKPPGKPLIYKHCGFVKFPQNQP